MNRRAPVEPDADAVVRAEDLEADVVSERIVAGPREDPEAPPPRRSTATAVSKSPYSSNQGVATAPPSAYTSTTS